MSNSRLISGRVIKKTGADLSSDRHQYLNLSNAEPDLANPIITGSVLTSTNSGTRSWSNSIIVNSNGSVSLSSLNVIGQTYFEDLYVNGTLTVRGDILGGPLRTDDIQIVGNRIETTQSNSNFEIGTAGSGIINFLADANLLGLTASNKAVFQDDVDIVGNLKVDGNINLGGNITIGDQTLDTVNVIADFTSNLIPNTDNTYDLGETLQRWRFLYGNNIDIDGNAIINDLTVNGSADFNGQVNAQNIDVDHAVTANKLATDDIQISGNRIETTQSNSNFEIHTSGTGNLDVNADTNIYGDLTVDKVVTDQILGKTNDSNLSFQPLGTGFASFDYNSAITLPRGNTTERPAIPIPGQIRYNSFLQQFEGYNGIQWFALGTFGSIAFSLNGDDSVATYIPFGGNLQVLGRGGTQTYVDTAGDLNIESRVVQVIDFNNNVLTPNLSKIKFTGPGVTVTELNDDIEVNINIGNLYNLGANIDGGAVESIYLFTQNLDGGVPYTDYNQTGTLDAGGVV